MSSSEWRYEQKERTTGSKIVFRSDFVKRNRVYAKDANEDAMSLQ